MPLIPTFYESMFPPSREESIYTLNIKVLKKKEGSLLSNVILEGSNTWDYESQVQEAINVLIPIFSVYFGYDVDYSINTDIENNNYNISFYLKDKPEEGEETPIDPPEEEPEEPTDPEEEEDSEDELLNSPTEYSDPQIFA